MKNPYNRTLMAFSFLLMGLYGVLFPMVMMVDSIRAGLQRTTTSAWFLQPAMLLVVGLGLVGGASSIGLVKRKNWARLLTLGLAVFYVGWLGLRMIANLREGRSIRAYGPYIPFLLSVLWYFLRPSVKAQFQKSV